MWLAVTQVFNNVDASDPSIEVHVVNEVNTDLIERVHNNGKGGLTLHMQSGAMIDISENMAYWDKHVPVGDQ